MRRRPASGGYEKRIGKWGGGRGREYIGSSLRVAGRCGEDVGMEADAKGHVWLAVGRGQRDCRWKTRREVKWKKRRGQVS